VGLVRSEMNVTDRFSPGRIEARFGCISIGEVRVFYREAGDPAHPTLLLLHGFPTSSHMFRNLMPLLADRFHVVAPDMPGFGFTKAPGRREFDYTFDRLAAIVQDFTDAIQLDRYAIYLFDYGAPVGLRLALARPERVVAVISQNGNAYEEGLSRGWAPLRAYWQDRSVRNRENLRALLTFEAIRWQYVHGAPDEKQIAPEAYWLDHALISRPGIDEIQLDLFGDYASNLVLYPRFQEYFGSRRPPILAVWGQHDPFFLPAGAEAFRRDSPDAEVHLIDTGHFALETHAVEIAGRIRAFMERIA
jgi:pimeloyl-ACP methyl ester carboxylesterase